MKSLAGSNLWLALTLSQHVFHRTTRDWNGGLRQGETVAFCRATQQTFLRLLTTKEVLAPYGNAPLTNAEAWKKYDAWLATTLVTYEDEPAGMEAFWRRLRERRSASPKLWMDAYLAAFAIAGGFQLVTTDKAFKQFKDLDCLVLG
jgi:toxin-antitoxin system PIN domain toxin